MDKVVSDKIKKVEKRIEKVELEIMGVKKALAALKHRVEGRKTKTFRELEGLWKGTDFSYEEIKAAEFKVKGLPK